MRTVELSALGAYITRFFILGVVAMAIGTPTASADVVEGGFCDVCTCANESVVCATADVVCEAGFETIGEQEQGICGGLCAEIGSSHGSRLRIEAACEVLPQCGNVGVPAASPLWLSLGALALVAFGAAALRRTRFRARPSA